MITPTHGTASVLHVYAASESLTSVSMTFIELCGKVDCFQHASFGVSMAVMYINALDLDVCPVQKLSHAMRACNEQE